MRYVLTGMNTKTSRRMMKVTFVRKALSGCETWDLSNPKNGKTLQKPSVFMKNSISYQVRDNFHTSLTRDDNHTKHPAVQVIAKKQIDTNIKNLRRHSSYTPQKWIS